MRRAADVNAAERRLSAVSGKVQPTGNESPAQSKKWGAGEMYFPRESHDNEDGRDQEEQTEHFCRQRTNKFI